MRVKCCATDQVDGHLGEVGVTTAANRIYGNGEAGVYLGIYDGWVLNNLIEANAGPGVLVNGASFSSSTGMPSRTG